MAVFDPEYKHTGLDRIGNIEQYLVNANGGSQTAQPNLRKLVIPPDETIITRFQSGHGFTSSGFGSINLNDTTRTDGLDIQAVTGATAGTGTAGFLPGAVTSIDPTSGKVFTAYVSLDVPANLTSLLLSFGSDGTFANRTDYTVIANSGAILPGVMNRISFGGDQAVPFGTGAGTTSTNMRFRLQDKNGQPISFAFGGVTWRAQASKATIVFTFDDSFASHYTFAKAALARNGFRGTFFPILEYIGQAGRMTLAQIQDLQNLLGHEVACHSDTVADHTPGFASLTSAQVVAAMQAMKLFQAQNGLVGDTLAYPSGSYNATVVALAQQYFAAARTTDGGSQETNPAWDRFRARAYTVAGGDSLATLEGKVDTAVTNGGTLIFTIHDVASSGGVITPANLNSLVDYVQTKVGAGTAQVRTFGEAMAGL